MHIRTRAKMLYAEARRLEQSVPKKDQISSALMGAECDLLEDCIISLQSKGFGRAAYYLETIYEKRRKAPNE